MSQKNPGGGPPNDSAARESDLSRGTSAPDPNAPPTKVDTGPRTMPSLEDLGSTARVADATDVPIKDIRDAQRIQTAQGSSAQANSGAPLLHDQIFGPAEDDEEDDDTDDSPKVVVTHTFVNGPGGSHRRGAVIGVRKLLGHELMKPENRKAARAHLKRYLDLHSIRPATGDEAQHDFITFPEGEEALTTALDDANARADAEKQRADTLQRQLDAVKARGGAPEGDAKSLLDDTNRSESEEFDQF
jgi:hypothetical protein